MHSSTSSFDRSVEKPWAWTWALALIACGLVIAVMELRLRSQGFQPSTELDGDLWALQRHKLHLPGRVPVAVVGASRISLGFDPEVFNAHFPGYRAVMLAQAASSGAATLQHLAEDESFRGIVLLSMTPYNMLRSARKQQKRLVQHYERVTSNYGYIDRLLNRHLEATIDDSFAFRNPHTDLWKWITGDAKPNYMRAHADYSRSADYSKIDIAAHRKKRVASIRRGYRRGHASPEQYWRQSRFVERQIRKIVDRGGTVVLVRFITCGEVYELDERTYPRAKFWDRFVAVTKAKAIHFEDYPGLRGYSCPDDSHIDARDSPRYTLELAKVMTELGVLEGPWKGHEP